MSRSEPGKNPAQKAVALQYGADDLAPVIVASGMGYLAEKIVETAAENGVPIYEDNSLSTILTQLKLGQEIPESLYQAIVEIYVYFLHFDPEKGASSLDPAGPGGSPLPAEKAAEEPAPGAQTEEERP